MNCEICNAKLEEAFVPYNPEGYICEFCRMEEKLFVELREQMGLLGFLEGR